jgi:hypothetical protein
MWLGKYQFTGRFGKPRPAEVLFERICRRNRQVHGLAGNAVAAGHLGDRRSGDDFHDCVIRRHISPSTGLRDPRVNPVDRADMRSIAL